MPKRPKVTPKKDKPRTRSRGKAKKDVLQTPYANKNARKMRQKQGL